MKKFQIGAVIVATKPRKSGRFTDYHLTFNPKRIIATTENTINLLEPSGRTSTILKSPYFMDIRKVPCNYKKVCKSYVQIRATCTGDGTYMASNAGYIYVLYVTKYNMICVDKNRNIIILNELWNLNDMFEQCQAPPIDYNIAINMLKRGIIRNN